VLGLVCAPADQPLAVGTRKMEWLPDTLVGYEKTAASIVASALGDGH
jgi:hypothetical protein